MRGASWRRILTRRPQISLGNIREPPTGRAHVWSSVYGQPRAEIVIAARSLQPKLGTREVHVNLQSKHDVNNKIELEAILGRAPHGINSLERLAFESDLGHARDQGQKLTDLPVNRQDLDLWLVLLEYRCLTDGDTGVYEILHGMRSRGALVTLINYDDASDKIWELALAAALRDDDVRLILSDPLTSIGRGRSTFFLDLVGAFLQAQKVRQAASIAGLLRSTHFRGREDLHALNQMLLDSQSSISIQDFCTIHHRLPFLPIYEQIIPALWAQGRADDAYHMHSHLLEHHDFPRCFETIEPFIGHFLQQNESLRLLQDGLERHGIDFSAQIQKSRDRLSLLRSGVPAAALDLMQAKDTGIRQRKLKDQFVARVFATHALSFEFALKSLKFFGLVEIGPLAVREMANSAATIEVLQQRFRLLQELEIDTGSSIFVIVLKRLCEQSSPVLLRAVLESDQHHDVSEDRKTQKRLLTEYFRRKDWRQINRTLTVLTRGETGPQGQMEAQHLLLNCAIVIRDSGSALNTLANITRRQHGNAQLAKSQRVQNPLAAMIKMVFSKDVQRHQSGEQSFDHVQYMIGLLQEMESAGINVRLTHWRIVLQELGRSGKWEELTNLVLWIGTNWRKNSTRGSKMEYGRLDPVEPESPEDLLDSHLQARIMWWSINRFGYAGSRYQRLEDKRRGFYLLQRFHEQTGLTLDRMTVRESYVKYAWRKSLDLDTVKRHTVCFDTVWEINNR